MTTPDRFAVVEEARLALRVWMKGQQPSRDHPGVVLEDCLDRLEAALQALREERDVLMAGIRESFDLRAAFHRAEAAQKRLSEQVDELEDALSRAEAENQRLREALEALEERWHSIEGKVLAHDDALARAEKAEAKSQRLREVLNLCARSNHNKAIGLSNRSFEDCGDPMCVAARAALGDEA